MIDIAQNFPLQQDEILQNVPEGTLGRSQEVQANTDHAWHRRLIQTASNARMPYLELKHIGMNSDTVKGSLSEAHPPAAAALCFVPPSYQWSTEF